jgi:hypothetical protein
MRQRIKSRKKSKMESPIKITPEQETFAMMRIVEMLQVDLMATERASDRHLLCAVYMLGRKDERENR